MPGRMATHSSARSAVRVRRGSTTTTRPPRSRMAASRPGQSGAVARLPLDSRGLAPSRRRWSVRSMSGTGTLRPVPNMRADEISLGRWSTVEAEKTLRVPSALSSGFRYTRAEMLWALGLPT